jgi:uncharacterized membrane protein YdjX (TVP38/TMEM64 family)
MMTRFKSLARRLPFLLILLCAIAGVVFLRDKISFDALARHSADLLSFRDANYFWASIGFIALYIATVALSLPGATIVTLTGGFLFGLFPGVLYSVVGATLGAALVFLAARAGFGTDLAARLEARGGVAARMQVALQQNQWSALLIMRLLPILPFFLVNLIAASVGVRLWPFVATTMLGIIPASLVFTSIGAGLGDVLAAGQAPDLGIIFTPPILLPLLGLAALAALPVMVKAWRGKEF